MIYCFLLLGVAATFSSLAHPRLTGRSTTGHIDRALQGPSGTSGGFSSRVLCVVVVVVTVQRCIQCNAKFTLHAGQDNNRLGRVGGGWVEIFLFLSSTHARTLTDTHTHRPAHSQKHDTDTNAHKTHAFALLTTEPSTTQWRTKDRRGSQFRALFQQSTGMTIDEQR